MPHILHDNTKHVKVLLESRWVAPGCDKCTRLGNANQHPPSPSILYHLTRVPPNYTLHHRDDERGQEVRGEPRQQDSKGYVLWMGWSEWDGCMLAEDKTEEGMRPHRLQCMLCIAKSHLYTIDN